MHVRERPKIPPNAAKNGILSRSKTGICQACLIFAGFSKFQTRIESWLADVVRHMIFLSQIFGQDRRRHKISLDQ